MSGKGSVGLCPSEEAAPCPKHSSAAQGTVVMVCLDILLATRMCGWLGSVVPKGKPVGVPWQREQQMLEEKKRQEEEQKKLSEEQKAKENARAPLLENKEVTGDTTLGVTAQLGPSNDPLLPQAVPPSAFICLSNKTGIL